MWLRRALCVAASLGVAPVALGSCTPFGSDDPATDGGTAGDGPSAPADAGPLPVSCKALLAGDPTQKGKRGFYDIAPEGSTLPAPLHVYCDFVLDGGGWTLVGRSSVTGVKQPFGWTSAAGDVSDLNRPYSMNAAAAHLVFAEVLVGVRADASFDVSVRAYKLGVPPGFIEAHANDTVKNGATPTLSGDCSPTNGGPQMLRYSGFTAFTDDFFLRDIPDDREHRGLNVDKLNLTYDDCDRGGSLDGHQGMILVR